MGEDPWEPKVTHGGGPLGAQGIPWEGTLGSPMDLMGGNPWERIPWDGDPWDSKGPLPWDPLGSQGSPPQESLGLPRVPSHGIPWAPKGSPPRIPWAPKGPLPLCKRQKNLVVWTTRLAGDGKKAQEEENKKELLSQDRGVP